MRKASAFRKVLPNLSTTVEGLPQIDENIYKTLTGKYEIMSGVNVNIFVDADKLMAKTPDGFSFQLFPSSETEYFTDVTDIQITFKKDDKGNVNGATFHLPERDYASQKVE
jgi:hypothetical protein